MDELQALERDAREMGEAMRQMPHPSGLTCIHAPIGLCESCQRDYDEDPSSWHEFGNHAAGIERWKALQAEVLADAAAMTGHAVGFADDSELPF